MINSDFVDSIAVLARDGEAKTAGQAVEVDGVTYWQSGGKIEPVHYKLPAREALKFASLAGLIAYVKEDPDDLAGPTASPLILHVVSPRNVLLLGPARGDAYHSREVLALAKHDLPGFKFGEFIEREWFNIALQSQFDHEQGHWAAILALIGNIVEENAVQTQDNGYAQAVVARTGVVNAEKVEVPNPVELAPFRAFPETEPVLSKFVLRVQGSKTAPVKCALFEADGGEWTLEATRRVAEVLEVGLAEPITAGSVIVVR